MQSISSIIQQVQSDLVQLQDDKLVQIGQNLMKTSSALQDANQKKISLLDERSHKLGDKKKLQLQLSLNKIESYIGNLKSKIKINLQGLQNNSQVKIDTKKRILNVLQEIDSSKTDILSDSAGGQSVALPPSQNVNIAMQAALEGKNTAKQNQLQDQYSNANREKSLYEKSSSLIKTQLDALKKSKIFKTIFQILTPIVKIGGNALASLVTAGAGSILLSNLISTAYEMIESTVMQGFNKKISNAKEAEKEIQSTIKGNEKMLQQLLKNSKNNELAFAQAANSLEQVK